MSFRSSAIVEAPGGYTMTGDLTIKGITQTVTFDAGYNGSNTFPVDQSTHFGFEATGAIHRSSFGISYGLPLLSDEVRLTLGVQFVRPLAERSTTWPAIDGPARPDRSAHAASTRRTGRRRSEHPTGPTGVTCPQTVSGQERQYQPSPTLGSSCRRRAGQRAV